MDVHLMRVWVLQQVANKMNPFFTTKLKARERIRVGAIGYYTGEHNEIKNIILE